MYNVRVYGIDQDHEVVTQLSGDGLSQETLDDLLEDRSNEVVLSHLSPKKLNHIRFNLISIEMTDEAKSKAPERHPPIQAERTTQTEARKESDPISPEEE